MVTMIHRRKGFVFHHIPKTGGSSICKWLIDSFPEDMLLIGRKGCMKGKLMTPDWWEQNKKDNKFPCHIHMDNVKKVLATSPRTKHLHTWHFAFMRDPYKWFESFFWYRRGRKEANTKKVYGKYWCEKDVKSSWKIFVETFAKGKGEKPQSFWIKQKGAIGVSFIGDYGNLEQDFKTVMSRFEIDTNFSLPIENPSPISLNERVYLWEDVKCLEKLKTHLKEDIELYEKTFNKEATYGG